MIVQVEAWRDRATLIDRVEVYFAGRQWITYRAFAGYWS